jgi:hypothetical protein
VDLTHSVPVGSSLAGHVVHLKPPPLRMRYRYGVYIDLSGFPDWLPYAAALVDLAPPPAGLTADEARLLDVLTANAALAANHLGSGGWGTPTGWVWAHLAGNRAAALVPAELHAAFRHRGGVAMRHAAGAHDARGGTHEDHGVRGGGPTTGVIEPVARVSSPALAKFEHWWGGALPESYREFLADTNGGLLPLGADPARGFLVDQPFFGLAEDDRMFDLAYVNLWLGDRFTDDFLAVAHVQGGLLAVKARGADAGSVWYWDDDDPADDERYGADLISREMLVRCADSVTELARSLVAPPATLLDLAREAVATGRAGLRLRSEVAGTALPRSRRPH